MSFAISGIFAVSLYRSLWAVSGAALAAEWLRTVLPALAGRRQIPDLSAPEFNSPNVVAPLVTIVVPARNESEYVEATLRSLLQLDYPRYEVIAVDDRSTDGTGEILLRMASTAPGRMRVMQITELPQGWLGKTHAMARAAAAENSDSETAISAARAGDSEYQIPQIATHKAADAWLLFTDADVIFRPDALRRALDFARQRQADHVALIPKVNTDTWGGRVLVIFFGILFMLWRRPWKAGDTAAAEAVGIGAFNLIRRNAYERIGGWQALRLQIVEDVKLGEAVKCHGLRQAVGDGQKLLSNHYARNARGVMDNLTKNFFAAAHYQVWRALGTSALFLTMHFLPFAGVLMAPGWARAGFALATAIIAFVYAFLAVHSGISPFYFFAHPFSSLLFTYVMLRSMALAVANGGIEWRGTTYPLTELRRSSVSFERHGRT